MKRIEMLMDVKDPPGYLKGEIRIVEDQTAAYFCRHGWAKDVAGQLGTGEPDTSNKTLEVHGGSVDQAADTPGVS